MRQYEADIRTHISVRSKTLFILQSLDSLITVLITYCIVQIEQQLKIYIENLKYKMECEEKEIKKREATFNEQI